jgi:DtxR family Mn-dependent transcriptional regulator
MQQQELFPLTDIKPATLVVVSAVSGQSKPLLEELGTRKIRIGSRIEVRSRSAFDQSIEIKLDKQTITITQQLASHLLVKKA